MERRASYCAHNERSAKLAACSDATADGMRRLKASPAVCTCLLQALEPGLPQAAARLVLQVPAAGALGGQLPQLLSFCGSSLGRCSGLGWLRHRSCMALRMGSDLHAAHDCKLLTPLALVYRCVLLS